MEVDIHELMHGAVYDPQKAHEYYLKRRQLKGRPAGSNSATPVRVVRGAAQRSANSRQVHAKANPTRKKSAKDEADARLEALLDRLAHLRSLLEKRIEQAKKPSKADNSSSSTKSTSSSSSKKVGSSGGSSSSSKDRAPLTAKQKRDQAQRSHKSYEKNKDKNPPEPKQTTQQDIEEVRAKIQEIQKRIHNVMADARKNANDKSKSQTARKGR